MQIHLITDDRHTIDQLIQKVSDLQDSIDYLHIREKTKSAKDVANLVKQLINSGFDRSQLVINDRVDAALLAGVNQVQLPSHSFDVKEVKAKFPYLTAGVSVHSVEEAIQAEKDGADYCLFGHIYPTGSKSFAPGRGTEALQEVVNAVAIPVIGIGGITGEKIAELKKIKPAGIAVMSAILSADHPRRAAESFVQLLKEEQ
ncbi:thiazole tautomerase TenI [Bacillus gobiensis]|uniref:thiazole tautomerase TenI n=1 Tax=Bacillus gobiensis TaxID=1441095 RepID=UPI003D22DD21